MGKTNIEWCDYTFNHVIGCSKVPGHPGCSFCYAEADMDLRRHRVKWGLESRGGTRSVTSEVYWREPLKWNKKADWGGEFCRPRVFCASLADVFEDWKGPILNSRGETMAKRSPEGDHKPMLSMDDIRSDLFDLIDLTPNLDWLLLTKRPENIKEFWGDHGRRDNVWLGYSASDQESLHKGMHEFLSCRPLCQLLFLSLEPLLGPIDLHYMLPTPLRPHAVEWVIVGGESGPHARPCPLENVESIIRQCERHVVSCFVKQLGAKASDARHGIAGRDLHGEFVDGRVSLRLADSKGGDITEWPKRLQVREFPRTLLERTATDANG